MINRLQRLQLMQILAAYYQNENVSSEVKKKISEALVADDNAVLHKEILKFEPRTETGLSLREKLYKKMEETL